MQRAVLLHGTDGSPDYNWFPWLKGELEKRDYDVWTPKLPESHTPDRRTYENYLRKSNWNFEDNLIIGHSSGATSALNLLLSDGFPKAKKVILVGTFLNERLLPSVDWYEPGQFDNLFPLDGFDEQELRKKCDSFVFIHGDNDPYCALEDTQKLAEKTKGKMIIIKNGLHLSSNRTELPEILPFI